MGKSDASLAEKVQVYLKQYRAEGSGGSVQGEFMPVSETSVLG